VLPPGLPPALVGVLFDHAFVVLDATTGQPLLASNSVPLTLTR
jgi:hypothetical protein